MKHPTTSLLLTVGILFAVVGKAAAVPALPVIDTNNVVNVTNAAYGAADDGVSTNTTAIQKAINAAAAGATTNGAAGGTVEIPAGTNAYLCGPITLKSSVNLQIDAGATLRMLPFASYPKTYFTNYTTNVMTQVITTNITWTGTTFISGSNLHDLEISGSGAIDGQGSPWWPYSNTNGDTRAIMISPSDCNRVLIQNLTLSNSPTFHIAISGGSSGNTTVQGVTIFAPGSSPNTDACDVDGTNILVQNCNISEGDDDFTCGGGTSDVLLTNNTYGTGHGISIGSYTDDGGVSNITVINCTMNGTENGIRIKSDDTRGGLVRNIAYYNIGMTNVDFPIQVYGYYLEVGTPDSISPSYAASQTVSNVNSTTPIFNNITFSNITATSVSGYPIGIIWARTEMPATNIVFDKVKITGDRSFELYNVSGAQFIDCNLTNSTGTTNFELFNAQVIITNSVPGSKLSTFDGLTTNGYDNILSLYNATGSLKNTNTLGTTPLTLSASTLTVSNNLNLSPATVLNYALGTNSTKVAVVGNLALGGTNYISAGPGFTNGTYTLLTYTGTLSGSTPALGAVPAGGFNYAFSTGTAGQVNLIVSIPGALTPAAPTNLAATAADSLVTLTWSPSATATNYNIKRSVVSGGPYAVIGSTAATNYADAQVADETAYYYVVSGVNPAGEGSNSAEVSAIPPATPNVPYTVFSDTFASSTLNSASSSLPSGAGASYELISSKPWSPSPAIAAGHLDFGIGNTTSGDVEVQALFASTRVSLAGIGDNIMLVVTFTNTSGLLTESGALGFGLYCSGQNFPVPDGLNGTATTSANGNATGNAQTWAGYVGQLAFTDGSSQIMTRPAQTTGTLANNDQDAVTSGSPSSSYDNPAGTTAGTASSAPSLTLVPGNPYTEVLTLELAATNVLAITNYLYAGTGTNGTLLSQFGAAASGATYLTNAFDALAIGWRATANTSPTTIDINTITVTAEQASQVSLVPTNLIAQVAGNQLQLSWPADHLGWRLEIQTNSLGSGLGTNWATVPNSTSVTATNIFIDPANDSVFLRLVYP